MLCDKRVLKLSKRHVQKIYTNFICGLVLTILETLKLKVEWVYFLSFAFRSQFENMSICCNVVYCFLYNKGDLVFI